MAEPKTHKNSASVTEFINGIKDDTKRQDCQELLKIFTECTGQQPAMWGSVIVGYGTYHYKSERSSQEGDWMMTGFSPRAQSLTLYVISGFEDIKDDLAKLGKHTTSVSCLYIKKLADVDVAVLKRIITAGYKAMEKQYGKSL